MIIEIKAPSPGESITEVEIGSWLVDNGTVVNKDQEIAEIESDKATLTITAGEAGKIEITAHEGDMIEVGAVVCTIDTSVLPSVETDEISGPKESEVNTNKKEIISSEISPSGKKEAEKTFPLENVRAKVTPLAKELMKKNGLNIEDVIKGLQRIGKREIETLLDHQKNIEKPSADPYEFSREIDRNRMSSLRRKLSDRLVSVKNETAMLTTFNEIDMSPVMSLRKKYQSQFLEKYGFKLGFMSIFTKAVALSMEFFPVVNSQIDGDDIITPHFVDVGIAVSTPKGLMVPVIRNAESKPIPQIELEIKDLAEKARNKKISLEELKGGTFTITNGGVFGSLLSTPIINPPQSAILGMHNIVERPVAVDGNIIIRPMMYVALSYDHRIIDGKDSVSFLVKVKEMIENPVQMFTGGHEPEKLLLDL